MQFALFSDTYQTEFQILILDRARDEIEVSFVIIQNLGTSLDVTLLFGRIYIVDLEKIISSNCGVI